jgi:hypothetical protein
MPLRELPSVPELHRVVSKPAQLADYTADREFHPAPKVAIQLTRL